MNKTPYETLEVDENATDKEIKQAYKDQAKQHHPDKGGDENKFKEAVNAYAILKDPNSRKRYDETGSTDTEDPLANIMADLSQMFFEVVQKNNNRIEHLDIIQEMLRILSNAISLANNGIIEKDAEIKKTEKLLSRITKKDDSENFFESIIKGKIKQTKYAKDQIKQQIEKLEAMIDIIDLYECSKEEQQEEINLDHLNLDRSRWFENR